MCLLRVWGPSCLARLFLHDCPSCGAAAAFMREESIAAGPRVDVVNPASPVSRVPSISSIFPRPTASRIPYPRPSSCVLAGLHGQHFRAPWTCHRIILGTISSKKFSPGHVRQEEVAGDVSAMSVGKVNLNMIIIQLQRSEKRSD